MVPPSRLLGGSSIRGSMQTSHARRSDSITKAQEGESRMKVEGGCYCGALRYQAEGDVMFQGQCHCRECQYISGGAENLVLAMSTADFSYTKGTAKEFRRSDLENPVTREFCAECGTHVVSRAPGFPMAMMKVGTLDDPSQFEGSQMALYTIDKQSFHHIPEGVATFERMPG
jgi:hypothetical protein